VSLRLFPVLGGASYVDDFAYAKPDGRSHMGNDLMSPTGTPLLAVDDGEARYGTDVLGGNVVNLYGLDGTRYYYAHLSRFEGGAVPGTRTQVKAGDVVGYVGTTGNAAGGPSHVHFEIHPGGGAAVDPYPILRSAPVTKALPGSTLRSLIPLLVLTGAAYGAYRLARRYG
jgi:murein DD-endopeptidase MepM/ murein hydrolase activator NlpD